MHVDVAVRAKLRAFAATDAPILDDDLEVFFAPDGADRALRHAKRVATRSTCGRDEKVFVAQTATKQSRHAIVRGRARANTGVAARAVFEIDQEEILGFEQPLIQKIIEVKARRNRFLLVGGETRAGDSFDLLPHSGKSLQH